MTTQIVQAQVYRQRNMPPALGIALYLWMRSRHYLQAITTLLILSTLTDRFFISSRMSVLGDKGDFAHLLAMLLAPSVFLLLPLLTMAAINIDSHLWVLPVRTTTLAGWLTIYGAAAGALCWMIDAAFVWRPAGLDVAIWWPAAAVAATQAALFAVRCQPLEPGGRQIVLYLLCGSLMGGLGILASSLGATPAVLGGGYLALIPIALGIAVHGARRSRRGEAFDPPAAAFTGAPSRPLRPGFRSAYDAQRWREARPFRFFLAGSVVFVGLLTLPIMSLNGEALVTEAGVISLLTHGARHVNANLWAELGPAILVGVLGVYAFAMGLGAGFGEQNSQSGKPTAPLLPAYPINSAVRVTGKLRLFATTTWTSMVALVPFAILWLLLPAWEHGKRETLGAALWSAHAAPITCAVLVLLPLLIWKIQAETLFLTMNGRPWIFGAVLVLVLTPLYTPQFDAAALDLGHRILRNPGHTLLIQNVLAIAAFVKLALCGLLLRTLRRRKILNSKELRGTLAVWSAAAVTLFVLIGAAFAPDYLTWPQAALAAILIMPGVRLALAPLADAWGRAR